MRSTILWAVLAVSLLSSSAAASGSYDVTIKGNIFTADGHKISDITVEFWEDDAIDDDFLGSVRTVALGYFEWSRDGVNDQEGATDPEIYLVVRFSGQKLVLSIDDIHNVQGTPLVAQITGKLHPEEYIQPGGRSIIDVGVLHLDHNWHLADAGIAYTNIEQILAQLSAYPHRVGVFVDFDYFFDPPSSSCFDDVSHVYYVHVTHVDSWNIRQTIVPCLTRWVHALSGTPPPSGGGFETVTNEGYAWDEGIKAFLGAALSNDPSAPGVGLESGVPVPSTADAPKIGASVAACLYDLFDSQDDDGPGLGSDQYDGTLPQIMDVLYRRPVQSLADFWNFWKADGLPRHFPVLALRNNGVDYNTPPVWIVPEVAMVDPGTTIPYRLDLAVSDEETPDNLLEYQASLGAIPPTDPVSYGVQGYILSATMNPANPPGHAHFNVGAFDGIAWSAPALVRIVWDDPGPKDPDEELDAPKMAREEQSSGSLDLALSGNSVIHSVGRFEFTLPVASDVRLSVYDVSGRVVDTIARGFHPAGRHEVTWSAEGVKGRAGMYFLELRTGSQRRTMRAVLVR